MRAHLILMAATAVAGAALASVPALAAPVGMGTVTVAALYNPTVTLGTTSGSFAATSGDTFEVSGTGALAGSSGGTGFMNGTLDFSNTVGVVDPESVSDFFVFSDGAGGDFDFSVASVTDLSYLDTPGVASAVSLYLLGDTVDTNLGLTSAPTSLTLTFNNNGSSAYSASATLSIPPSMSGTPEPSTWALMIAGVGMIGLSFRQAKQKHGFRLANAI